MGALTELLPELKIAHDHRVAQRDRYSEARAASGRASAEANRKRRQTLLATAPLNRSKKPIKALVTPQTAPEYKNQKSGKTPQEIAEITKQSKEIDGIARFGDE
jgi:hypothetical protein